MYQALFFSLSSQRSKKKKKDAWSQVMFYIEASSSYFILRLCPHLLYWGFVLIFYFEALSSCFILRLRPHCFILRLCSSVWGFGPHCCRPLLLCLYCLFDLFAVICVWFCLFVFLSRVTRCQYYLIWISIHNFHLFCLFFSIYSCNPLFWFTCSYINFYLRFCWLPCFDMCGHFSPAFIVMGYCNAFFMLYSPRHITVFSFVVFEEFTVNSFCLGDPDWFINWFDNCSLLVAHSGFFKEVIFIVFSFYCSHT